MAGRPFRGRRVGGGDLPAVDSRHHHVQDRGVWPPSCDRRERLLAIGGLIDRHAFGFQVDPAEEADRLFVVDEGT